MSHHRVGTDSYLSALARCTKCKLKMYTTLISTLLCAILLYTSPSYTFSYASLYNAPEVACADCCLPSLRLILRTRRRTTTGTVPNVRWMQLGYAISGYPQLFFPWCALDLCL